MINSVVKQVQIQAVNVTSIEAELMAIHIGLIPTMENDNIHNIIVITDSISAASKILELSYDRKYPFNNIISFIFYIITNFYS